MKNIFLFTAFIAFFYSNTISAQEEIKIQDKYTAHNKGKFFVSWGGNRESYTKSDVNFRGKDYNFTVENMVAHDKPKGWHVDYINPVRMTIPQTNFRIEYFMSAVFRINLCKHH